MKFFHSLLAICLLLPHVLFAQAPAGYYSSAEGLSGSALESALRNIIDGHNALSYDGAKDELWEVVEPENGRIRCVYTGRETTSLRADTDGMNAEHTWPQSRGAGSTPPRSDLHHLFVTDADWNSRRGSLRFSTVSNPTATSPIGAKVNSSVGFEPPDETKGDIARAIFYFSVRYNLDVLENPTLSGSDGSTSDNNMGILSDLIDWHFADPPSTHEVNRNNRIFGIQGNRNPFIDRPEFITALFNLGPTAPQLSITTVPSVPRFDTVTQFQVTITAASAINPFSAEVFYRIGGTGTFTALPLVLQSGTTTNGTWVTSNGIPVQPGGTMVQYYTQATDSTPLTTRLPTTGQFSFTVFEPGAPVITAATSPAQPIVGQPIFLTASIVSEDGVNPFSVEAEYSTSTGQNGTIPLELTSGSVFNGQWSTTQAIEDLEDGDILNYAILAEDTQNRNTRQPAQGSLQVTVLGVPQEINLSGYKLIETDANLTVTFPNGTLLPAGGVLIVSRQASRSVFEARWGTLPASTRFINAFDIIGGNGLVINGGEIFELRNAANQLVDGPTATTGISAQNARVHRSSLTTNSWSSGTAASATPGVVGLTPAGAGLRITEFADPASSFTEAFVEITYDAPAPVVVNFTANVVEGTVPLTVQFTDTTSGATPGNHQWDFDNNGTVDSTLSNPSHTYTQPGLYSVKLTNSAGTRTRNQYINVDAAQSASFIFY
ncbi:MAG: endonuclease [Candidatus Sumerlaeia bacterium]|nr:endonuclease [Candidatus Sumerlaeia bacterium]